MSIAFRVLGSGSSGNASVARLGAAGSTVLFDLGFSPRSTRSRLEALGLDVEDVSDVVLTHLDHDHCHRGWCKALRDVRLRLHVHRRHQSAALRSGLPVSRMSFYDDRIDLAGDASAEPVLTAHDRLGSVAFVVEADGARLGWATDLGRVPSSMLETFVDLDAIAIESNYDRSMQLMSERPSYLKNRIMGGAGHLSNMQALEAIARIADRSQLQHIVLLHVSRDCNCPRRIRRLFEQRAPGMLPYVTISSQEDATDWIEVTPSVRRATRQMALFG